MTPQPWMSSAVIGGVLALATALTLTGTAMTWRASPPTVRYSGAAFVVLLATLALEALARAGSAGWAPEAEALAALVGALNAVGWIRLIPQILSGEHAEQQAVAVLDRMIPGDGSPTAVLRDIHPVAGLMLSVWRYDGEPQGDEYLSDRLICDWASAGWRRISYVQGALIGTTHAAQMPPRDQAPDPESWPLFDRETTRIMSGGAGGWFAVPGEYPDPERPGTNLPVYSVVYWSGRRLVIWTMDQRHGAAWERLRAWRDSVDRGGGRYG